MKAFTLKVNLEWLLFDKEVILKVSFLGYGTESHHKQNAIGNAKWRINHPWISVELLPVKL